MPAPRGGAAAHFAERLKFASALCFGKLAHIPAPTRGPRFWFV
jgi:hypothetical protein